MESTTCTVDEYDGQTMCLINPEQKKQKIHKRPVSTPCLICLPEFEPDHDLDDMVKEESPTPSPPPMLLPELTHRPTLARCPIASGTPVSPSIMTHSDIVELGHYTSTPVETPDPEYSPLDYGYDYSERLNDFFAPSYPVSMVDESDDDRDLDVDFIDDLQTGSMTLSGCSMSSSLPLFDLVMSLDQTEEDILMAEYGYTFKYKLRDTTQGIDSLFVHLRYPVFCTYSFNLSIP